VQSGEKRSRLNLERAIGNLCDPVGDAKAVKLLKRQGFENEQIERALQEGSRGRHL
jgi:hypothetical protein